MDEDRKIDDVEGSLGVRIEHIGYWTFSFLFSFVIFC